MAEDEGIEPSTFRCAGFQDQLLPSNRILRYMVLSLCYDQSSLVLQTSVRTTFTKTAYIIYGELSGVRTQDLRIKSPLLYRLS